MTGKKTAEASRIRLSDLLRAVIKRSSFFIIMIVILSYRA